MTQIDLQIILFFILVIYIIYRILVRTSSKIKKFNIRNRYINFVFVGLIGVCLYLVIEDIFFTMIVTIIMSATIIYENKKVKNLWHREDCSKVQRFKVKRWREGRGWILQSLTLFQNDIQRCVENGSDDSNGA